MTTKDIAEATADRIHAHADGLSAERDCDGYSVDVQVADAVTVQLPKKDVELLLVNAEQGLRAARGQLDASLKTADFYDKRTGMAKNARVMRARAERASARLERYKRIRAALRHALGDAS